MGDPAGPTARMGPGSDESALAFGVVRPLLGASSLKALGVHGLEAVRRLTPTASRVFGWFDVEAGRPAAWRCTARDAALRPLAVWRPTHPDRVEPLVWRSRDVGPDQHPLRHQLWLPVLDGAERLGGFELTQYDPFEPATVTKLAGIAEAMGHVGGRLRERAQAIEQRRHLEAAVQARTAFFAQTSHELRTPLNAILGYVELLIEEGDELSWSDVIADLSRVHASARHLLDLVNDVLDLAKAEHQQADPLRSPVDVSALVEEIDDTARPLMAAQGNRWVVSCPAQTWAWADAKRLRQVLLNLVGNAAKFTDHGEVQLSVERFGDEVFVTIADSGIGMSRAQVDRLFTPFEQVHDDGTFGGTGLGLAISAQYVQRMGGRIEVSSEVGVGTRFAVKLAAAPPG